MVASPILLLALPLLSGVNANTVIRRAPPKAHNVIVQVLISLRLSCFLTHLLLDRTTWSATFKTSLPAGTYCDIIHDTDTAPKTCSGPSYVVSSAGQFTASVAAFDALALFSGFS
ncbi:hypothetical protein B0H16DRAFT_1723122 [Mycena metata]|uniref:Alpha-amylase C-terminal domain-containing protein n=1 Tax=Mycena metata TaxID=1033252 RepID=A0AAD7NC31_9AGAR|nr:hypothetical protein B0H16DRAFT_1723122 [Mycena metata]